MFDIDKWQEILATINKHKLRTLLTAFGVFWGIFMLVLLMGTGKGLQNGVYRDFANLATNSVFVWAEKTSVPYHGLQPGRFIQLTNEDTKALKENIPEINYIAPRLNLSGEFSVSRDTKNGSFQVLGTTPDIRQIKAVNISDGRFLDELDGTENRKIAVIGPRVVQVLFGQDEPIGQYINIKGSFFKVVGVFKLENTSGGDGRDESQTIYIPLSTLQRTFDQVNYVGSYAINIKPGISVAPVEKKIKAFLEQKHDISPNDARAIGSWNAEKEFQNISGLFTGINIFNWIVGIGTIIAGIVGVSNIMLIIVKERTREIGVRKALGATPWSIVSLIIQESVVITSVSGYMGLVCGVGTIQGVSYLMNKFDIKSDYFSNPEINFHMAIIATIILVIAGTLAGLIPALKASKINPIEALRTE
ncbi:MAG TPA: ABC transporter permease [Bacteroidia bacterium]|nr:ABC transporter permease [Bacteroidia bacterium]